MNFSSRCGKWTRPLSFPIRLFSSCRRKARWSSLSFSTPCQHRINHDSYIRVGCAAGWLERQCRCWGFVQPLSIHLRPSHEPDSHAHISSSPGLEWARSFYSSQWTTQLGPFNVLRTQRFSLDNPVGWRGGFNTTYRWARSCRWF